MKSYEDLSTSIKLMLEDAVSSDPYGLSPSTLYKNIVGSLKTVPVDELSKIMEVSLSLIMMIDAESKEA